MKQIFTHVKYAFLIASLTLAVGKTSAQTSTSVGPGMCGLVQENFNNTSANYTSPSIYGDPRFDSAFYYNQSRGIWTEMDGGRTLPATFPRVVSILSIAYKNPLPPGIFDVGFYYIVPNAAVDRFNVSLVRLTVIPSAGGDITQAEVVARSGFQFFSNFSTPTAYIDPTNPVHNGMQGSACIRLTDADITKGDNITYRVEVSYQINSSGNYSAFDNLSLGSIIAAPLPVDFIGLAGKRENNLVNLQFNVVSEKDVAEYQIERSENGASFKTIGKVASKGKTIYNYSDGGARQQALYYRVKSVDIDGRYQYSSIIKVAATGDSYSNTLAVYPIPARNQVTVQHHQLAAKAKIIVSTVDGRTLKVINAAEGASHTPVDLSDVRAGMYVLRLEDGSGKTQTLKFVKQ